MAEHYVHLLRATRAFLAAEDATLRRETPPADGKWHAGLADAACDYATAIIARRDALAALRAQVRRLEGKPA